jgi:uncharacterized membrane protein HdeD (DUF308 family)
LGTDDAAKRTAERRARRKLAALLETDNDLVPCPDCGWFQADMARQHRHIRASPLHGLQSAACILLLVGGLLILTGVTEDTDWFSKPIRFGLGSTFMSGYVSVGLGIIAFAFYLALRGERELNVESSKGRALAGMPRPFKPGTGRPEPSPFALTNAAENPAGWVTVQLLDLRFPSLCARCLTSTTEVTVIKPPLTDIPIQVPQCAACSQWVRKVCLSISIVSAFAVAVAVEVLVHAGHSNVADWAGYAIFGTLGLVAGYVVARAIVRLCLSPVRFRRFSSRRNLIDIRFVTRRYREPFLEVNQARPGE